MAASGLPQHLTRAARRGAWAALPLALALWLASGLYSVQSDESAVAFLLGRVVARDVVPGIAWNVPPPLGRVVVAKTTTNFTMPIGFRMNPQAGRPMISPLWLTGDTHIVTGRLTVQYRIRSLTDFLLSHANPRELLRSAGERTLTRALVREAVDDVLTTRRSRLQKTVRRRVQETLDAAGVGIDVQSVNIEELAPPRSENVRAAFQDVQNARSDRERSIYEAGAYRAQTLAAARGERDRLLAEARAARHRRIELARGDADRFLALADQHRRAPRVTEQRLYLETLERLLPTVETFVVQNGPDGKVNLRVVQ